MRCTSKASAKIILESLTQHALSACHDQCDFLKHSNTYLGHTIDAQNPSCYAGSLTKGRFTDKVLLGFVIYYN